MQGGSGILRRPAAQAYRLHGFNTRQHHNPLQANAIHHVWAAAMPRLEAAGSLDPRRFNRHMDREAYPENLSFGISSTPSGSHSIRCFGVGAASSRFARQMIGQWISHLFKRCSRLSG